MDILLRHTLLGEAVRLVDKQHLAYAEERNPAILKHLTSLQAAQNNPRHADENSALLADGEDHYGSGTLLVDWYNEGDLENPQNWPKSTKWVVTIVICIVTVAMYTGSSFWSVCIDDAIEVFGIPNVVAQLGRYIQIVDETC